MDQKERSRLFAFFAAEGRNLRRYVSRRLRDFSEADAEDIIGDVMLRMVTRAEARGPLANPVGYVYRALNNGITDFRRAQGKTISLDNCLDEDGELSLMALVSDQALGPEDEAERRALMRRFGEALGRLEPRQRAVFIATEMNDETFRALSARWHEPIGTLLSRKSRAVQALRKMLQEETDQ